MQGSRVVKYDKEHQHNYVPKLVETTNETAENILWNHQVKNGRTIANNKSVFIRRDNEKEMSVNRHCIFRRYKCDQERSRDESRI
jgi:hypothetical protein